MTETTEQQGTRERQRVLFDAVAGRYRKSRQGYPEEVVRWMVETAGLTGGAEVLEIGCGTGQLTAQLAEFRFRITAIDIGPSMIDAARCQLDDSDIRFEVTSFEDIEATPASDLIASATAFHWIDPAVAWTKLKARRCRLTCSGWPVRRRRSPARSSREEDASCCSRRSARVGSRPPSAPEKRRRRSSAARKVCRTCTAP